MRIRGSQYSCFLLLAVSMVLPIVLFCGVGYAVGVFSLPALVEGPLVMLGVAVVLHRTCSVEVTSAGIGVRSLVGAREIAWDDVERLNGKRLSAWLVLRSTGKGFLVAGLDPFWRRRPFMRAIISRVDRERSPVGSTAVPVDPPPPVEDPTSSPPTQTLFLPSYRPGLQVIPRPARYRKGDPAPWADVPAADRAHLTLDRVVEAVRARPTTDGPTADTQVAEFIRSYSGVDPMERPAAVLVALFEEDGDARVVLTVRSSTLRAHRGEVAFPGGRLDPGEDTDDGAFREASEEVGLDRTEATVVGHLTPLPTVSSNTLMTPVVATLPGRPALTRGPDEVDRVFDVALAELVADGAFREEWWSIDGRPGADGRPGGEFPVWFYEAGEELIWGATARVLTELLCLVLGIPAPLSRGRTAG